MKENYFEKMNSVNVDGKTEAKKYTNAKTGATTSLTYLSWAYAWGELKKIHPEVQYHIYENAYGLNYHHDGKTAWVKIGVKIWVEEIDEELEHIKYLPVMNFAHNSIMLTVLTSKDVNAAIQRKTTKAITRHGLGFYIYSSKDICEEDSAQPKITMNMSLMEKPNLALSAEEPKSTIYISKNTDSKKYEVNRQITSEDRTYFFPIMAWFKGIYTDLGFPAPYEYIGTKNIEIKEDGTFLVGCQKIELKDMKNWDF